jgi:hypothetical protein
MKNMVPWCTGEPGAESAKATFLDEHIIDFYFLADHGEGRKAPKRRSSMNMA